MQIDVMNIKKLISSFIANKFFVSAILGLNSGLSYALLGSTFTAYLNDYNVHQTVIGLLSLRTIPYSFKYLWSPFIDSVHVPLFPKGFGQRKRWILVMQVLLTILIGAQSFIDISRNFNLVCALSFITAFVAATYDIAMEAYRIELFSGRELNKGSMYNILGFRLGLIISGAVGLYLASVLQWKWVFLIMAAVILPCIVVTWFAYDAREVKESGIKDIRKWFRQGFVQPFIILMRMPFFYLMILIIAFYKVSDSYLDTMLIPFLTHTGYTKAEIATIAKTGGLCATIAGTVVGHYIIDRFNIMKNLFFAECGAAITNLLYITLVGTKGSLWALVLIMCTESFISGVCNIALINLMSRLCDSRFTATHYATLISISGFARAILSSTSGWVAVNLGWVKFFIVSASLSLPALLCILMILSRKETIIPGRANITA